MKTLDTRSTETLIGVHPLLVKLLTEAIKYSPIYFTLTDGVRTIKQQQELYASGRTRPGPIVTYVDGIQKKSNHQPKEDGYGHAVDMYANIDGCIKLNDINSLKIIAEHVKKTAMELDIPISWGGDWKSFKDYPHFELHL